jgi:hypothetical protein
VTTIQHRRTGLRDGSCSGVVSLRECGNSLSMVATITTVTNFWAVWNVSCERQSAMREETASIPVRTAPFQSRLYCFCTGICFCPFIRLHLFHCASHCWLHFLPSFLPTSPCFLVAFCFSLFVFSYVSICLLLPISLYLFLPRFFLHILFLCLFKYLSWNK